MKTSTQRKPPMASLARARCFCYAVAVDRARQRWQEPVADRARWQGRSATDRPSVALHLRACETRFPAIDVHEGDGVPQQLLDDEPYEICNRCLETEDEYFDYAPVDVPPRGRWSIYGIGLPEAILRKTHHDNATRLLGLST